MKVCFSLLKKLRNFIYFDSVALFETLIHKNRIKSAELCPNFIQNLTMLCSTLCFRWLKLMQHNPLRHNILYFVKVFHCTHIFFYVCCDLVFETFTLFVKHLTVFAHFLSHIPVTHRKIFNLSTANFNDIYFETL